jgi:hypothetical protein
VGAAGQHHAQCQRQTARKGQTVDFFVAVRLIVRRWYVVASALVVTLVIAFTVMQSVAPSYRAEGSVLLFAPSAGANEDEIVNPFRSFDSSTSVLAAVMVQVMNDPVVRNRVGTQGGIPDYEIGQSNDGTPVIVIRATSSDEAAAIESVEITSNQLREELTQRQADAGAPENIRIQAIVLVEPSDADLLVGDRIRAFIVVTAIGVAASISLAFLIESIAQSRQRATVDVESPGGPSPRDEGREFDDDLGQLHDLGTLMSMEDPDGLMIPPDERSRLVEPERS